MIKLVCAFNCNAIIREQFLFHFVFRYCYNFFQDIGENDSLKASIYRKGDIERNETHDRIRYLNNSLDNRYE